MKKVTKFLISLLFFTILIIPSISTAARPPGCTPTVYTAEQEAQLEKGLTQCGRRTMECTKDGITSVVADTEDACNFNELMHLINNIISFILFGLAIPIAGIMFAYAGFTLLTSGGSSSAKTKAKEIFFSAGVGLVISFMAYIIVVFVLKTFGYNGSWIFKTF